MTPRRALLLVLLPHCSPTTGAVPPAAPSPPSPPPPALHPVAARAVTAVTFAAAEEKTATPATSTPSATPGWELEELRSPSPGVLPREARAKGVQGGEPVIAVLSAICRQIAVVDARLGCAAPWNSDAKAIDEFDLKEGSFSRAGAQQAFVSASVGSDAYTFRHFLLERRRGRWIALNTFLLEGEVLQQRVLKDRTGRSLLLRAVHLAGFPMQPLRVQALRFTEQGIELSSLADFAGGAGSDPEGFALSRLSVSGTRFLLTGAAGSSRAEKALAFDYDGQHFIADAEARATLDLGQEALEWEAARSWDLDTGASLPSLK